MSLPIPQTSTRPPRGGYRHPERLWWPPWLGQTEYAAQFNAAAEGSQMRTSMLLAGVRLALQCAKELDASDIKPKDMSDKELAAYRAKRS